MESAQIAKPVVERLDSKSPKALWVRIFKNEDIRNMQTQK
jgi:hypothetical protein